MIYVPYAVLYRTLMDTIIGKHSADGRSPSTYASQRQLYKRFTVNLFSVIIGITLVPLLFVYFHNV